MNEYIYKMTEPMESQTENIAPVEVASVAPAAQETGQSTQQQVNLLEVAITDENTALNVIVGFLGLAQKRGTFAINEAAKIYECIKMQLDIGRYPTDYTYGDGTASEKIVEAICTLV